ncbi:MAG: hypothetical protein HXO49_03585 [Prevotella sp.]|nr:hypothetical protein [Prevotella sp.]
MQIYGARLINGNISTMLFESRISNYLKILMQDVEYYALYDFEEEYNLEDLGGELYIEILSGEIDEGDYLRLRRNRDWTALDDRLTESIMVHKPCHEDRPFGLWKWCRG